MMILVTATEPGCCFSFSNPVAWPRTLIACKVQVHFSLFDQPFNLPEPSLSQLSFSG